MATRSETQQKKARLRDRLLQACRSGELKVGEVMPPIRHLAREHELSLTLTNEVIKDLVNEGVLYTMAGAGTFVGRPSSSDAPLFLMILPHKPHAGTHLTAALSGFEDRLAQYGACTFSLDRETALDWISLGKMPAISGVFELNEMPEDPVPFPPDVARVVFGELHAGSPSDDRVLFDDFEGGKTAASHLIRQGHRSIAFLGIHNPAIAPDRYLWSAEREHGWRESLEAAGIDCEGLQYRPSVVIDDLHYSQVEGARLAALTLVQRTDVTAIIAANRASAHGLFNAFRACSIPPSMWPVVVCFDDLGPFDADAEPSVVTAMRLPWEEIGREAAELGWSRAKGLASGPGRERLIQMRLIPRLSCRPRWAAEAHVAGAH